MLEASFPPLLPLDTFGNLKGSWLERRHEKFQKATARPSHGRLLYNLMTQRSV